MTTPAAIPATTPASTISSQTSAISSKQEGGITLANKPLEYKGHPLQRAGNIVYYGSMSDKYVIMLQIMGTKKVKSEKDGFWAAMDVASVWLDRALAAK